MTEIIQHDCLVIGAGPVGLATARALELRGLSYALCGQLPPERPNSPDLRTAALFGGSIRMLERLGAWPELASSACPLSAIRIIDATGHLLRAPEQLFHSDELHLPRLGYNISNPALVRALSDCLEAGHSGAPAPENAYPSSIRPRTLSPSTIRPSTIRPSILRPSILRIGTTIDAVDVRPDRVIARLDDGTTLSAHVAIAADGRNSMTRAAAGITTRNWDQNQSAITAHFDHTFDNAGISTEIHTKGGPCTVVPLAPNRSSLVWMDRPERCKERAALTDDDFAKALDERLDGLLGPVRSVTVRRIFPLSSLIADRFAAHRVALVGESAHAFPPIGAQGLNLGLRDVASLADHLSRARAKGLDLGADSVLEAYSHDRSADIAARTYGVDAFNASLSNRAAGLLRGALLHATKAAPAIKRFLMERGMSPVGDWPELMK